MFGDDPTAPRGLLAWAGWDYERLERSVHEHGLTPTLERLRDDGVYFSSEEFKGRRPIRRGNLVIEPDAFAFANPGLQLKGLRTATSGTSSGESAPVAYDWSLFREEAALECLLFESHGVLDAPSALWLPTLPSISGLHNVLVHLRFRRPPERWFSQLRPRRRDSLALGLVHGAARTVGLRAPLPEAATLADAETVFDWLLDARARAGTAVLKTFASSAVRLAAAARSREIDLDGCLIFVGGEPLTDRRRAFIESTGARAFSRYVATETGWVGAACPQSPPGAMHLYSDRLAVIPGEAVSEAASRLLFTTLSASSGTILLNTDIGDAGRLSRRPCTCPIGLAGLSDEVSGLLGHDKVSYQGATFATATLAEVLDEVVEAAGGGPDSYQLRHHEDATGAAHLVIVVAPDVRIREDDLVETFLDRLLAHDRHTKVSARLWQELGTIEVQRAEPDLTAGGKLAPALDG
jgi:hypothetical protein